MTKQDEIKEGIHDIIKSHLLSGAISTNVENAILSYLHSRGVVIKVDGPLPDISYHTAYPENEERYQQAMLEAGFEAVEPLIKEVMPSER